MSVGSTRGMHSNSKAHFPKDPEHRNKEYSFNTGLTVPSILIGIGACVNPYPGASKWFKVGPVTK